MQHESTLERSGEDFFRRYGGSAAENYQRFFVPSIAAPFAESLLEIAALQPAERVLDVACGTGAVTRLAKVRVGRGEVAGLDSNAGMLAVAKSLAAEGAISWHEASAEAMPLPSDTFDAVLCQLGLQFFADKIAALREMRRVLADGGRVVVSVAGPTPSVFAVLSQALARSVGPRASAFVEHVFSLRDQAALESLLREAGLRDVAVHARPVDLRLPSPAEFLWQYVRSTPLSALVTELDDAGRAALERDVVAGWKPFVKDGVLTCQVGAIIASGRK